MTDATPLDQATAEAFREKCRAFRESADYGGTGIESARAFLREAAAAGLGGIVYGTEYGGAGLTKEHDRIWRSEKARYPAREGEFVISHGMCLPMLNDFGTEEQKRRFMPANITAETMWCQMFSEPGAGSDVASLQTRAIRDGDEWIVNGQKVWTTLAHKSDYGILIARTNPDVPKHAGISMFIVDMRDPAVEIRPIHQIDGGKHFNEVFFTDLRVPKDNLLGDLNNGWRMATAMLMYERVAIGTGTTSGISRPFSRRLIAHAQKTGRISDPVLRQELMKLYSEETAKSLVSMRTRAELKAGKTPGPGGSLGKLHGGRIMRHMRTLASDVGGIETVAHPDGEPSGEWTRYLLGSFSANIAGGTDEIQKNIIGDRVLGLPREPAVDKGVPFRELKVGTQAD